jgi:hypothetical protein
MPDNELAIKITGDASKLKEATDAAKEQIEKAGKSVDMLGDLIGVKVPDGIKQMLATSELVGPALEAAFVPLAVVALGMAIFEATEKAKQHREELERSKLEALDVAASFAKHADAIHISNLQLQDQIATIERKPARNGIVIAMQEGKDAVDDLILEFRKAIAEESKLAGMQKQGFWNWVWYGADTDKEDFLGTVEYYKNVFNTLQAEMTVAERNKNEDDVAKYKKAINDKAVAYRGWLLEAAHHAKDVQSWGLADAAKMPSAPSVEKVNQAYADRMVTINTLLETVEKLGTSERAQAQHTALEIKRIRAEDQAKGAGVDEQAFKKGLEDDLTALKQNHLVSVEEERNFLQSKLALAAKYPDEYAAVNKRIAELDQELFRKREEQQAREDVRLLESVKKGNEAQIEENNEKIHAFAIQERAETRHDDAVAALQKNALDFQLQIGKISQQQHDRLLDAELEKEYQKARKSLELERAAAQGNLEEEAKVDAKIEALDDKHRAQMQASEQKSYLARTKNIDAFFSHVKSAMDQSISGFLKGTERFAKAWQNMWSDMVISMVQKLAEMMLKWIQHHITMMIVHTTEKQGEVVTEAAAATQKNAIQAAGHMQEMTRTAERAAGHAYDAMVNIPIVGPVLAPVAAGVAFAAVEAFGMMSAAGGQYIVPSEQLTMLHKNEMVLPAGLAGRMRDVVEGGGGDGGGGRGGGHMHFHFSPIISAVDSSGVADLLNRHKNTFESFVTKSMKKKGFPVK